MKNATPILLDRHQPIPSSPSSPDDTDDITHLPPTKEKTMIPREPVTEARARELLALLRDLPDHLAVADTEATSKDPREALIIEYGVVVADSGMDTAARSFLVDPQMDLPDDVAQLTGINSFLLGDPERSPALEPWEAMLEFDELVHGRPVFAYGAVYDMTVVAAALESWRGDRDHDPVDLRAKSREWVCVCDMARVVLGGEGLPDAPGESLPNFQLATVCERLGVHNARPHRALPDAYATWQVLQKLRDDADRKGLLK